MRYLLSLSYDGTSYSGWQTQKNAVSIQSVIQDVLQTILKHPVYITGAGRTDAKVHATAQRAHFDTDNPLIVSKLQLALNALLPKEIRIMAIEQVADHFHARHSARRKIYHYHLHLGPCHNPFTYLYRHFVKAPFHRTSVEKAIRYLIGTHDFTSFANHAHMGSAAIDPIRTIYRIELVDEPGGLRLAFEANGFLYKMVRNITGVLLAVGSKRMAPEEVKRILEAKTRRFPFKPAPPQGLFLHEVLY